MFRKFDTTQRIVELKADFHSSISGAQLLRLIVDLGMRTYNRKARESDRVIAKKVEVC